MRASIKSDVENIARRIHVGSANELPLKKPMNVYLHPPERSGSSDHSRPAEIITRDALIKGHHRPRLSLYYPRFIYSL